MTADADGGAAFGERFEVTLTPNKPDQLLAFNSLAKTFGWQVQRLAEAHDAGEFPVDAPTDITDADLCTVSRDFWGVPDYGQTAASLLEVERKEAAFTVTYSQVKATKFGYHEYLRGGGFTKGERTLGTPTKDLGVLEERINGLTRKHPLPFDLSLTPGHTSERASDTRYHTDTLLYVEPQRVTRTSLAAYVVAKEFDHHNLHGAIGRALDVLSLVAGVREQPRSAEFDQPNPDEFIKVTDLLLRAKELGLSSGVCDRMIWGIGGQLRKQLTAGKPTKDGEVIVDGAYDATNEHNLKTIGPLRITRPSLSVVARSYKGKSPAIDFLNSEATVRQEASHRPSSE